MDLIEQSKDNIKRHPWELARFEIFYRIINSVLPLSPKLKTIVDIGCGDCYFARQLLLRRNDLRIIGIDNAYTSQEIDEKIKEIGNEKFTLFSDFNMAQKYLKEDSADLLLLLDVIEHIKNDTDFLNMISESSLMSKNTHVVISVPAFQTLFSTHDAFLRHYRRYSKKHLKAVISNSGLKVLQCRYFFFSLFVTRFFQKLTANKKNTKRQKGIGQWEASDFITRLVKNVFLTDYKFSRMAAAVGVNLPGLSVYCICKRPVL